MQNNKRLGIQSVKPLKYEKVLMMMLTVAPCLFIRFSLDNDAYWLIESGRYVLTHGIPTIEPLTLHDGLSFVMQQWLSAVCFAWIYDTFGFFGLMGLVVIVFVLTAVLLQRLCLLIGNNEFVSYMVAILSVVVLWPFMTTRPFLISLLLFLLEIIILEKFILTKRSIWLLGIPILSMLLINLHAALWPFLFIIAIPYIIDSISFNILFLHGEGYPRTKMMIAFGIALLAGFLNPYGIKSMTYLFRSYGHQSISSNVLEMQSPNFQTGSGLFVFLVLTFVVLIIAAAKPQRLKLRYGLLMLGTAFMALTSLRNLSLFAICGMPMLAYVIRDFSPKVGVVKVISLRKQILIVLIFLIVILALFPINLNNAYHEKENGLPKEAVIFIHESYQEKPIRLFADYNWGGYTEFMGLKPFIDARAEVFLKVNNGIADILDDYLDMSAGELYYLDFIKKYDLNVFLIERGTLLDVYLSEDKDFHLVYKDQEFVVYELLNQGRWTSR